jgi:hypothetical protein
MRIAKRGFILKSVHAICAKNKTAQIRVVARALHTRKKEKRERWGKMLFSIANSAF